MNEKKRIDYIDIAKGFALLLVIFGHTFRDSMRSTYFWCDFSYSFVYRFHVSLLFLLSGMSLSVAGSTQRPFDDFFAKRVKGVLLPWFTYSVLIYLLFALAWLIPPVKQLLSGTSYTLISPFAYLTDMLKNENPYSFHLWYLLTLFLFDAFAYVLDRIQNERVRRTVKFAFIAVLPAVYSLFCTGFVWTFKSFYQQLIFFLVGTLLTDGFVTHNAKKLAVLGIPGGAYVVFALLAPVSPIYELPVVGLLLGYVETAAIMFFCIGITAFFALTSKHFSVLASFGRYTMPYYLYHQPFCCAFLGIVLYDRLALPAWLTVICCMFAGIAIPWLIIRLAKALRADKIMTKLGLPV